MKPLLPKLTLLLGAVLPLAAQVPGYPPAPLHFESTDRPGIFAARTPDAAVRVSADTLEFSGGARMRLLGAQHDAPATVLDPLPGASNYFIGSDRSRWRTRVPHFAKVRFAGVYPGVDLVYHGDGQQIEYDFALAPHADAGMLRLSFDGASRLALDRDGNLTVTTASATLRFRKPVAYQDGRTVAAAFRVSRNGVAFRLGPYDKSKPLLIDPTLVYSSCFGGSKGNGAAGIVADAAGNAYIVGTTSSVDFVPAGATTPCQHDGVNCYDVFVTKLSPTGLGVYTTFLGGSSFDDGAAIALDAAGSVYISGTTGSPDFPTLNPFQSTLHGSQNAFAAELNAAGALVYSTYLGGSPTITFFPPDGATGIAVDAGGNATIGGQTTANDLPLLNPFRSSRGTGFVSKLNASGSALIFSSYVDGAINALAGDSAGNIYAAGTSSSTTTATSGAAQSTNGSGFLAKISATGSLVYNTLLGGTAKGVSVDAAGNAYVTGSATSSLVLVNALYSAALGSYVAKVNPPGSAFLYSTYWYGQALAIATDAAGNTYVAGQTVSAADAYPVVNALQSAALGVPNPVLAKFSADGSQLLYSTYFGSGTGGRAGVAVDGAGDAFLVGSATAGFPTLNSIKPPPNPAAVALPFVAKIADANPGSPQCAFSLPTTSSAVLLGPGDTGTFTVSANSGVCSWQATTNAPWITITSGATGSGIGSVGFSVALNPTLSQRSGQIMVNGLMFTVYQAVPSHVDATSASGAAGSTARVPITFVENENVSNGIDQFDTFTVTFSVTPNSGSPSLSGALAFQQASFLPAPQISSSGPGNITLTWSAFAAQLSGTNQIGELLVPIPSTATSGQTYVVESTGGKATQQLFTLNDTFAPGAPGTLTVAAPSQPAPAIAASGIVNAASYTTRVVFGEIASIFGTNLAASTASAAAIPLPTQLSGASVLVDGVPAPLFYVSAGQINFQMPWRLIGQQQTTITVMSNGFASNAVTITVFAAEPALFSVNSQGTGQGEILSANYVLAAPIGSILGVTTQPVSAGQYILIYCTGLGRVYPSVADGAAAPLNPAQAAYPSAVNIGGIPATITFAGLAPGLVALYQVNVIVPAGVPAGPAVPVVFLMGGGTAPSNTVTIAIQ
jgi:uncharacterized protein (TIGR03437 family)